MRCGVLFVPLPNAPSYLQSQKTENFTNLLLSSQVASDWKSQPNLNRFNLDKKIFKKKYHKSQMVFYRQITYNE